jgi:hypothetical protein
MITNMDDIQVSFTSPSKPSSERDRLKPFRIYNLTPIDVFTLTEREAWQLTKTLIAALQGYNSKSL